VVSACAEAGLLV